MYVENVIGELLYIGLVAEKGRCYGGRWKVGYKKILRRHIIALNELQKCFYLKNESDIYTTIEDFIRICDDNYEIGKFYQFVNKSFKSMEWNKSYDKINEWINELFQDLLLEIRKPCISKKNVYVLLCALHNLPRVYLGKDKETLCELRQEAISEQDAVKYAIENMSSTMKKKYGIE